MRCELGSVPPHASSPGPSPTFLLLRQGWCTPWSQPSWLLVNERGLRVFGPEEQRVKCELQSRRSWHIPSWGCFSNCQPSSSGMSGAQYLLNWNHYPKCSSVVTDLFSCTFVKVRFCAHFRGTAHRQKEIWNSRGLRKCSAFHSL